MKFKGFFEQGNCVFITGVSELRWGKEDEYQLKVKEVTLLENAGWAKNCQFYYIKNSSGKTDIGHD